MKRLLNTTEAANPNIRRPINALYWVNWTGLRATKVDNAGRNVLNSRLKSCRSWRGRRSKFSRPKFSPLSRVCFRPVAGSRRSVRPNNLDISDAVERKYWVLSAPSIAFRQSCAFSYSMKAYPLPRPRKSLGMKTKHQSCSANMYAAMPNRVNVVPSFTAPHVSNFSRMSASVTA